MRSRMVVPSFVLLILALAGGWSCSSDNGGPMAPPVVKELDSGDIATGGGTYQHRFFSAGSFPYHCVHHGVMTGTVTVSASATDTVVSVIIASTAPFAPATVLPGGRVVWTNNSTAIHTVTSD